MSPRRAREINITLSSEPRALFDAFSYAPGQTYKLTATMQGESLGRASPQANYNTLTIALIDDAGRPAGTLGGYAADEFYNAGPATITSAGQRPNETTWAFSWTAPKAGMGAIHLHVAGVDGNAAGLVGGTLTDPFGDDVFVGALALGEAGRTARAESGASTSACGTTTGKPAEGPVCAMMGCHGTETGRPYKLYARGRLRNSEQVANVCPGPSMVDLAVGTGSVMCLGWTKKTTAEWDNNYDNSRALMVEITNPDDSDLLLQAVVGGKAHTGVHLFEKSDPAYQTIKAWLGGARLGSTCDSYPN